MCSLTTPAVFLSMVVLSTTPSSVMIPLMHSQLHYEYHLIGYLCKPLLPDDYVSSFIFARGIVITPHYFIHIVRTHLRAALLLV